MYSVHYCKTATANFQRNPKPITGGQTNEVTDEGITSGDQHSGANNDQHSGPSDSGPSEGFLLNANAASLDGQPLQHSSALFLIGLKEKYKLTQVSIQGDKMELQLYNEHQIALLKSTQLL